VSRDQLQGPQRIVCLTEETTETLYLLGEHERIVGTSGFIVRPPQARKEKPTAAGVLRGVRRAVDLGDPLGLETHRNRRRRGMLSRSDHRRIGQERIIADPNKVVGRAPDIIISSWCGTRFRPERVKAREGWDSIPAVRTGHIHEIKSADILQPGPAALTDGLAQICRIIERWAEETSAASQELVCNASPLQ
jgi:ABC-type Fe3+-hydroxamate transport system substrate-binding protein